MDRNTKRKIMQLKMMLAKLEEKVQHIECERDYYKHNIHKMRKRRDNNNGEDRGFLWKIFGERKY